MRILILTDHYPPYIKGGAELNCALISDALKEHGHDVTILTTYYGLPKPDITTNVYRILPFVEYIYSNRFQRRIGQLFLLIASIKTYFLTRKVVTDIQPDVVFTWNFEYHSLLSSLFAVQDMRIPNLFSINSHWPVDIKREYEDEPDRLKKFYRSALIGFRKYKNLSFAGGIFVSNTVLNNCKNAGVVFDNTTVIYNGIPDQWIKTHINPFPSDNKVIRLLYVGRYEEAKGTDVAIKTVANLVNHHECKNVHLDLYGKGDSDYMKYLNDIIFQYNLSDYIDFHPQISRETLVEEYSKHDILLFTTPEFETLSNVILEAISRGVLVISSSIGATRELIEDHNTGFLVPPNDPGKMASTVKDCIKLPEEMDRVRKQALKMVQKKFCLSKMIDSYNEYLQYFYNLYK